MPWDIHRQQMSVTRHVTGSITIKWNYRAITNDNIVLAAVVVAVANHHE